MERRRLGAAATLALVASAAATFALAACGGGELPPCDAPEREAHAAHVAPMAAATRDSITQAFAGRSRIQVVRLEQSACHFRATVRVDSFTTRRYASVQGTALVRALKKHAPGETRPLAEDPASEVGDGIYDYAVTIERSGQSGETRAPVSAGGEPVPWVRLTKRYDDRRVILSR